MRISKPVERDGLRDIAIAILIVALVALSWSLVAEASPGKQGPVRRYYPYILGYSYILLLLPPIFAGKRVASVLSILAGLLVATLLAADLTTLRFFDAPFFKLYPYLPVTARSATKEALVGYAMSYVPPRIWLLAGATVFLSLGASGLLRNGGRARLTVVALLPLLWLASWLSTAASAPPDPRIVALMDAPAGSLAKLEGADRPENFSLTAHARTEPKTIIFVIMESTGASTPSATGKGLLSEDIVAGSGAGGWVDFPNAVTNSNATDISVPTLLTGGGAHEPAAKLHALPFVSQYAAARGYRTSFITSSTMRWGAFETFFAGSHMDEVVTAEDSGLPFINDLAVDDHFVYKSAADRVAKADGKLFLTLYPQSLHWPFQAESIFGVPASIREKRARASYIAASGFRLLFDALRKSGRLDDALIIIAGDHGEFDYASTLRMPRMRMDTFDEGILSPIFLIKASSSMPGADIETLKANSGKLVANLDIAPTVADMLGGKLENGLSYAGYSLLRPVPSGRVAYSTSTNEWRRWTSAAIAVSRGQERMTCGKADLCRLSRADGTRLTYRRPATPDDDLFRLAAGNPVTRQALGQIYRNHYR